ncbi:MAG: SMI1/KNR4 family protein [Planctomycetes bacterium]|nr:SMI1/KNR4 family protein [Planctomycetota bacterium]
MTTSKTPTSSKSASQAGKTPTRASAGEAKPPAGKPQPAAKAPGASGKAKRKPDEAPAPPAAAAPPLVRPELAAMALETSSRVKRQRVLDVIIPQSTSARMAEAARASVWAISSEKTTIQFEAAEAAAEAAEERRSEGLVADDAPALTESLRRSPRDLFAFMREELDRPEDDPRDPHGLWRRAHKRLRHELSPGPAPEELERLEARLGAQLPPSYWDFSLEWGGGLLFVHEFGAIRIVPALELHAELRGPLCGRMVRPYLPVVDLGCGDYLALDMARETKTGEHPLVWWYGGEVKKKVADSFVAFLKRLVESNGQPFWWEA